MQIDHTDIVLWNALKNGDRDALGKLFSIHYPILIKYGSKICPDQNLLEDSIQDLFAEIWQSNARPEIQSVKAYLLKALKYKLFKKQRYSADKEYVDGQAENILFEMSHENFLVEQQENKDKTKRVIDALNQLPSRQREIIYLKIYQELSYEDVSDIMSINYQVARNLMSQAIKTLKRLLMLFSAWYFFAVI